MPGVTLRSMRTLFAAFVLAACALTPGAWAQRAAAEAALDTARGLLTGPDKDANGARKLLVQAVDGGGLAEDPEALSYALVYLGYIEDRAGNRTAAVAWFRKALAIEGGSPGILDVARAGLERPVTWIRHLEEGAASVPLGVVGPPKKAYVTLQQPPAFTIAVNLTAQQRTGNFNALCDAIGNTYADFKLKSIDWGRVCHGYRERLAAIRGDDDFYELLFQLVNELHDTHSALQNYRPRPLATVREVALDIFAGRPYVVAVQPGSEAASQGVAAGWEVLRIDGLAPEQKMEALRPYLHACSTERAYHREAVRSLLAGEAGSAAAVTLRATDGTAKTVNLRRSFGATVARPEPVEPLDLTRLRYVRFGRLPSGLGYVRIESFNDRQRITDEFDRALEELRDVQGLVLDIRDNPGGFGQPRMVGRLLHGRVLTSIGYLKSGSGYGDLKRVPNYLGPSGDWQYGGPVALLVNDETGSAADLFACELRSAGRVITVGSPTHGNLAGVAAYVVLPCGLVVRVSNGYVADAKGRPIEGAGSLPDITVEPSIDDFLQGRDPVLDRAVQEILHRAN